MQILQIAVFLLFGIACAQKLSVVGLVVILAVAASFHVAAIPFYGVTQSLVAGVVCLLAIQVGFMAGAWLRAVVMPRFRAAARAG